MEGNQFQIKRQIKINKIKDKFYQQLELQNLNSNDNQPNLKTPIN